MSRRSGANRVFAVVDRRCNLYDRLKLALYRSYCLLAQVPQAALESYIANLQAQVQSVPISPKVCMLLHSIRTQLDERQWILQCVIMK